MFDGFLSVCRWVEVFFAWRPSLPDEADNRLVELAVAGNAMAIVTRNTRDLARGELRFPSLKILTPSPALLLGHELVDEVEQVERAVGLCEESGGARFLRFLVVAA